jgi:hypothetical protein
VITRARRGGAGRARGTADASPLSPSAALALRATGVDRRLTGFAGVGVEGVLASASADSAAVLRRRVGFGGSGSSMRGV